MSNINRAEILKYFIKKQFTTKADSRDSKTSRMSTQSRPKKKIKWTTLIHNGVKFPPEYVQKSVPLIYDGKEIVLSKDAEEYAFLYARYIGTDYVNNTIFNKNFFNDWKKILGPSSEIKDFSLCDFSLMKRYLELDKEQKKLEKEIKKKKELEKSEIDTEDEEDEENEEDKDNEKVDDEKYKFALVDGKVQEISNYKVEPPGLFIGRGKNKNLGKIKRRLYPEDVILNLSVDAPIPELPDFLKGHAWEDIIHDQTVMWLASYLDSVTGKTKYVWLSSQSEMKATSDQEKFNFARKLKKKIKKIMETNGVNMRDPNEKIRQVATALFLIDKLAIRVGNEKPDDSTDVVGATGLRVEHIDLSENNKITLNFLGKDSVPYTNTIVVDDIVYKNMKEFVNGKDKGDDIFDRINSNDVNRYLQSFMKNLTAKVFRTYNASLLMQKELNKITRKYADSPDKTEHHKAIFDEFIKANLKVAKLMNHQKKISEGYKNKIDAVNNMIETLKKKLAKARKSTRKNPTTIENLVEKIKNYKSKKEIIKEMKNTSLETSKANYVDPRILVSFVKKNNIDINKILSKALQTKFKWAMDVDEDYKF